MVRCDETIRGLGEYLLRDVLNASSLVGLVAAAAVFNRRMGSFEDSRDATTKSFERIEATLSKLDAKITDQGKNLENKIAEQGKSLENKIAEQGKYLENKIVEQGDKLEKKIDGVARDVVGLRTRVAYLQGARSERNKLLRLSVGQPELDEESDET